MTSQGELRKLILTAGGELNYLDDPSEIGPTNIALVTGLMLDLLTEINRANGTRHYIRALNIHGGETPWYRYYYHTRQYKLGYPADESLSLTSDHVTSLNGWRLSADTVINQQRATIDWPKFPFPLIKVWEHETLPVTTTLDLPFTMNVTYPDYVLSCPALVVTSTGDTLTEMLDHHGYGGDISLVGGNAVVSKIEIWGREAVREPTRSYVKDDLVSQALPRGVRAGPEIGGDMAGSFRSAEGICQHVVWRYAEPQLRPTLTVTNWLPGLALDLYDLIALTSTQLHSTARIFEIVEISEQVNVAASSSTFHFTTTYTLQEQKVVADPFFILDDASYGILAADASASILAY